ncbi:MAG: hypothetical protein VB099_18090 [Candidatus Limiplasma sp.]|nr:hypothetical protein [Candidatus Limiplasma sp.]
MTYEEWAWWQAAGAPEDVSAWRNGAVALNDTAKNGIIIKGKLSDRKPIRYPVTQEQIDEIVKNDLSKYPFPVQPVYNPQIRANGITRATIQPWGQAKIIAIEIGKQDSPRKKFLVDTVLHKWFETEIMIRQYTDPEYRKLHEATDAARYQWINAQIKRYFEEPM